jgi:ribosomal-protein-alanine N-acetyltransferase
VTSTPTGVFFSDLTADDVDAVVEIERSSFERPWSRDHFLRELDSQLARTIVARSAVTKRVLGYVCRWIVVDEMQILNLAVHRDHRRRGIGRQLMHQALDEASDAAIRCVTLEVREANLEAVALYESLGFARVGRRSNYYGEGNDGVLMTLTTERGGSERT